MTLQAVEPVRVTIPPQEGWVPPELAQRCEAPGCPRLGTQWHHVVRRTATGGPVDWVAVDGVVIWNKLRLCLWCHDRINSHKAWLLFDSNGDASWSWWVRDRKGEDSLGEWRQQPKSLEWFCRVGWVEVREARDA